MTDDRSQRAEDRGWTQKLRRSEVEKKLIAHGLGIGQRNKVKSWEGTRVRRREAGRLKSREKGSSLTAHNS
jgi:hypothetical protein